MAIQFHRAMIESLNKTQSGYSGKNKQMPDCKQVVVPEEETFKYVFEKAKKGNEMAAVLLDEWQRSCKPKDDKEEQVVKSIKRAVDEILK